MNELKNIQIINSFDPIHIDINSIYFSNKESSVRSISNNTFCIALSNVGYRGVAGSLNNNGLWYTNNGGKNWIVSETNKFGNFTCICINSNGNYAVAGSNNLNGLWYSNNGGRTWIHVNINSQFNSIVINTDGTIILAVSSNNNGIYYIVNSGINWQISNFPISGSFTSIVISSNGINGVVGSNTQFGLLYSFNSGKIWYKSTIERNQNISGNQEVNLLFTQETTIFDTSYFNTLAISSNGSNVIAGSSSNTGLWYSRNGGVTWRQSQTNTTGNFYTICITSNGTRAMAADTNNRLWYSNDSGVTWTQQTNISSFMNSSTIYPNFYNSSLWYRSPSNIAWKPPNIPIPWIRTYTNTSGDFFPVTNLAIELRDSSELIQIQMMVYSIGQMTDIDGEKKIEMKCLFLLL